MEPTIPPDTATLLDVHLAAAAVTNAGVAADTQVVVNTVSALPTKLILQMADVALVEDGFAFRSSAAETADKIFHILKKHERTRPVYLAMEMLREAIDAEIAKVPPASTTESPAINHISDGFNRSGLQEGFSAVQQRVQLKRVIRWDDLVRMKQTRSVYLGRNRDQTYVMGRNSAPPREALLLVERLDLDQNGLRVRDGMNREHMFDASHPLTIAAREVAGALATRGIDAGNIDATSALLCYVDRAGRTFSPSDLSPPDAAGLEENVQQESISPAGDGDGEPLASSDEPPDPADAAAGIWTMPVTNTPVEGLIFAERRLSTKQIEHIHKALKHLASLDADHAQKRNGVGFSGADTKIGCALAAEQTLTPRQASLGRMLVIFHKKQLAGTVAPGFIESLMPKELARRSPLRPPAPLTGTLSASDAENSGIAVASNAAKAQPATSGQGNVQSPQPGKGVAPYPAPTVVASEGAKRASKPRAKSRVKKRAGRKLVVRITGVATPSTNPPPAAAANPATPADSGPPLLRLNEAGLAEMAGVPIVLSTVDLAALRAIVTQAAGQPIRAKKWGLQDDGFTRLQVLTVGESASGVEVDFGAMVRQALDGAGLHPRPVEPTKADYVENVRIAAENLLRAPNLKVDAPHPANPVAPRLSDGTRAPLLDELSRAVLARKPTPSFDI